MTRIAAIGEVMVELAPFPTNTSKANNRDIMALSFGGDTYNTSVYMARLGLQTDYVTQLGDDPYSQQIIQRMATENIGADMIQLLPGRSPGLYIIRNTPDGEREFFYWRKEAPARELFSTAEASEILLQKLLACDCVYLSGITLAIIGEKSRQHLFSALEKLRAHGITIAFDSNYRPRLWTDKVEAQSAMLQVMQHVDIALLTLDDEVLLWGEDSIESCKQRYATYHLRELILKRGAEDAVIIVGNTETHIPVPSVAQVIDTTGAGDTFNAGYLAARLQNRTAEESAHHAIRCASIVIRHRGAVIEKSVFENELALHNKRA